MVSKKFLLAGTALVAASLAATQAQAASYTLTAPEIWAGSGAHDGTPADDVTHAQSNDNVAFGGYALTVSNDGNAGDSADKNLFTLGALTGNAAGLTISADNGTNDLSVIIGSANLTGTAAVNVNNSGNDAGINVSVTGDFSANGTGDFNVTNTATSAGNTILMSIGGATTIGGATNLTAGAQDATITNNGASGTYTGIVTLNAGAAGNATLNVSGAGGTTTFVNGLVLNDGAAGLARLIVDGSTGAQTVAGDIDGATDGEGTLISNSITGVSFSGAIGVDAQLKEISVINNGGTTFGNNVDAVDIGLAHSSGQDTFSGTVTADDVTISGDNSTGKGTYFNGNVTADVHVNGDNLVTLGAGKKITGDVTTDGTGNKGTLTLEGAGEITGAVGAGANKLKTVNTGTGTATFDGAVYATNVNTGTGSAVFKDAVDVGTFTAGAGALDFQDTLTGTAVNLSASSGATFGDTVSAGTLTLGSAATVFNHAVTSSTAVNLGSGATTFNDTLGVADLTAGTGVVVFNDTLTATGEVDLSASSGATFAADASVDTLTLGDAATTFNYGLTSGTAVNLGAGATAFNEAISVNKLTAGTGTIAFNDTLTATGEVDLSASSGVTFGAAASVDSLTLGSANTTFNYGVTSATALTLGAGTTTFNNTLEVADLTAGTGAVAFNGAVTASGTVDLRDASAYGFASTIDGTGTLLLGAANGVFNGAVVADDITAGTGTLDFKDMVIIANDLDLSASSGYTFEDGLAVGGTMTLGATNATFANAIVADAIQTGSGTATFNGTVDGLLINLGAGTATFAQAVTVDDIHVSTGLAQFNNTVAGDVTFTGAGTATLAQGLTGNIGFGGFNATANVAGNVNGGIATSTTDTGNLIFTGGTQSVSGAVGDGTHLLHSVTAGQNGTTTFTNGVYATTISAGPGTIALGGNSGGAVVFADDGVVRLDSNKIFTGSVDTDAENTGTFVFQANGTITGDIGTGGNALKKISLAGSGVTSTVNGDIVAAQTTELLANTLHTDGSYTQGAGQTLALDVTGAGTYGKITADGNAALAAGTNVYVNIVPAFTKTETAGSFYDFTVVNGAGGTGIGAVTLGGPALWTYAQQSAGGADLIVRATRRTLQSVTTNPNNANVATALEALGGSSDPALQEAYDNVLSASSVSGINKALETLTPTVDGSVQQNALSIGMHVQSVTDIRLASLRSGDTSGMAAGAYGSDNSVWAQAFGSGGTQDARDGVAGYDSTVYGAAFGMDSTNIFVDTTAGIAVSYGNVSSDSDNANATETEVDSYGVSLYGTVELDRRAFLDASLGYAYNNVDVTRHDVNGPGSGVDADGSTNSSLYNAKLALGQDIAIAYGTTFTPSISAAYTHLKTDGYQETGPGVNLSIGDSTVSALDLGIDGKLAWRLRDRTGDLLKPSLHLGYAYDVIGDRISQTSYFLGGGAGSPTFATEGPEPEQSRVNAGLGATYASVENWDLSANYNYTFRSDYNEHAGTLRVTSRF